MMNSVKFAQENEIYKNFLEKKAEKEKQKKDDILSHYPMKLLAYSNEVGAAISPINKHLGAILWAPALLYLGADIYDKYKNDNTTYNPSAKRSVRQAIFQGFASVLLPTAAIKAGQKIGVNLTKSKSELSAMEKKELVEFSMGYLENSDYTKANNSEFTEGLINTFKQKAQKNRPKIERRSFAKKVVSLFTESDEYEHAFAKHLKSAPDNNPVISYLEKQGKLITSILSGEPFQNTKYVKYFDKAKIKYESQELAKKETLMKLLKDKNIDKSKVATVSGFIALALLATPIDYFVEYVLMDKIVDPVFDKATAIKNKLHQKANNKKTVDISDNKQVDKTV